MHKEYTKVKIMKLQPLADAEIFSFLLQKKNVDGHICDIVGFSRVACSNSLQNKYLFTWKFHFKRSGGLSDCDQFLQFK